jgi:branched-chain amino acid aminotransferase
MIGKFIIYNGDLADPDVARFGLDDTDITYGYGCYEVLKLREGYLYFPDYHEERLLASAGILGIQTNLQPGQLVSALHRLVDANGLSDSNLRVVMIGHDGRSADWYAFQVPPLYPPVGSQEHGVDCLLYQGQRAFPAAKSLNMLVSTIAFRQALKLGCYDALLVNQRNELTEGSRTNIFWLDSRQPACLYTPPAMQVLSGITRKTVMSAVVEAGYQVKEMFLNVETLADSCCSFMITSTSSTILPIKKIIGVEPEQVELNLHIPDEAKNIREIYKIWLAKNKIS